MVSSSRLILFRAELMASLTHSAMLVCSVSVIRFIRAKTSGLIVNENAFVNLAFFINCPPRYIIFESKDKVLLYNLFFALRCVSIGIETGMLIGCFNKNGHPG